MTNPKKIKKTHMKISDSLQWPLVSSRFQLEFGYVTTMCAFALYRNTSAVFEDHTEQDKKSQIV